jgi:Fur family peroxide stress response transcriptional regulator
MGYEKLTEAGLKVTIQRMAILEYLENTKTHPSAEMVYNEIKKKYPNVTISTIYNTLEIFVQKGIVEKIFTLQGKARYDAQLEKHHHFYDKENGEIIDIYDEGLNKLIEEYLQKKKFKNLKIETYHIDFTGKIDKNKKNNK